MIEVLISTVVLAVGLLGLAGLQASSLRSNLSAYHRSQATQLAYDMSDRIRANIDDAAQMGASTYATLSPASATIQAGCNAVAGTCSTAQLAENDLFEWHIALSDSHLLPSGVGTISVAGLIYTITVEWDDDRDGDVDGDDPDFEVSFRL